MFDITTLLLSHKYTDAKVLEIARALKYMGSKPKFSDLPIAATTNKGHVYTISGTDQVDYGHEYVSDGTQWVDLGADLHQKQDKLIAGANITIAPDGKTISATGGSAPQYIELSFYQDGDTGTLTDAQIQVLLASEINYIWLNGMHRLDFRYRHDSNNKATYSAVDTSSDGNKTHSVEINLATKAFKVYHRTLQEKLTAGNNITISGNIISATGGGTSYTAGDAINISDNKINVKYDGSTIKLNSDGKLYATAGGQVVDCNSVGMIVPFAGTGTIPSGYLYCDGAAVSRTTYSELFAVIGTTYGPGDGSTTFNLPDLREKFVEGSSASKAVGTSISAGLPNITASVAVRDTDKNDRSLPIIESATGSFNITTDGGQHATLKYNGDTSYEHKVLNLDASTSSSVYGNSTTVQPNAVVAKYIIKYTNTLGTLTTVIANPTLAGTEEELTAIQIGNTKYSNLNYHPFPTAFNTTGTLQQFGQSIVGYENFATGCTWFGGIQCSDLPGDMMQVECKVTAIRDTRDFTRNIAIVEIFSSEVAPFYWTYNTDSWNESTGLNDWKYVAAIDGSRLDSTAVINTPYNVKVRKVNAAAGSKGWEFYTEKAENELPAYPTDTTGEYILALKYENGAWKKYWKETINKSDIVDKGMADYMTIKE